MAVNHKISRSKQLISILCIVLAPTLPVFSAETNTISVDVLAQTGSSWDGNQLPAYPREQPYITILKINIPAGAQIPLHKHPVINAGVILRGELTVVSETGKSLHLRAGDAIVELVNQWHYGKNAGDKSTEIIVFYAGTPHLPTVINKISGNGAGCFHHDTIFYSHLTKARAGDEVINNSFNNKGD